MELKYAILVLWILCSMLGCWVFSLCIRLLSERRARKKRKLDSCYSMRSIKLALGLIVLCVLGSGVSGFGAYWIGQQPGVSQLMSVVGSLGIGAISFGSLLGTWAMIGDRSRGRSRCPKCWYDMSESGGMPCPECGREVGEDTELYQTKRPRWAFGVMILLVLVGTGVIVVDQKLKNKGLIELIPDRILLSYWEDLPVHWVVNPGTRKPEPHLRARIENHDISKEDRRALATAIIEQMIDTKEMRWDPTRRALLQACFIAESFVDDLNELEDKSVWVPENDLLWDLYRACAMDIALILTASDTEEFVYAEMANAFILDSVNDGYSPSTIFIAKRWLTSEVYGMNTHPNLIQGHQISRDKELLSMFVEANVELRSSVEKIELTKHLHNERDLTILQYMFDLFHESGTARDRLIEVLDHFESSTKEYSPASFSTMGSSILSVLDTLDDEIYRTIERWIRSDDIRLKSAAIWMIYGAGQTFDSWTWNLPIPEQYQHMLDVLYEVCIGDQRLSTKAGNDRTIDRLTKITLIASDQTGVYSCLLMFELMTDSPESLFSVRPEYMYSLEWVTNWLNVVEDQTDHPHPNVRLWIIEHLPSRSWGELDPRIDKLLLKFVDDPDEEVQRELIHKAYDRNIEID